MVRNLIVTGGLGFIGSNFIHHILNSRSDLNVTNIDNESLGSNRSNLRGVGKNTRYSFLKGDLANYPFTRRVLKKGSMLVNFAAQTHVDRSIANPEPFFESNTRSVFNLVRAVRETKLETVVHVSTDEVYGSKDQGSFDENSAMNPSSPYSATKAAADLLVQAWNKTYDLRIVTLRCTNNFGPRQHPEKFIPKAIIRALNGKTVPLYGGGTQVRDWIYVDDFCHAIELALTKGEPGQTYNISAGNEVTNREVAQKLIREIDNSLARIVYVEDRPGHDTRYSLNSEKARARLGWKPIHTFDQAIAETVRWYRENERWWKPLATRKVLADTPWKEGW